MARRRTLIETLKEIGHRQDDDIPLAETALTLAALQRPHVDLAPYHQHLADLAVHAAEKTSRADSVEMQTAALRSVLVDRHGYHGDSETYDDLRNANLLDVIDRHRGLPVSLGILYIHAARAYGADIVGIDFPSHFLLRLAARGQRVILDPFYGAKMMHAPELRARLKTLRGQEAEIAPTHYRAVGFRDILLRLQNNIKLRAIGAGDLTRAIDILQSMTLIAPDRGEIAWETGVLLSRLGNVKTAIATLESYLAAGAVASGAAQIEELLRRLKAGVQ
ncbi:MAG: transglutaminase-like domain-containing protein [Rhodospirillales bacterium]